MKRGQTTTDNRRTSQLLDRISQVGRFDEKLFATPSEWQIFGCACLKRKCTLWWEFAFRIQRLLEIKWRYIIQKLRILPQCGCRTAVGQLAGMFWQGNGFTALSLVARKVVQEPGGRGGYSACCRRTQNTRVSLGGSWLHFLLQKESLFLQFWIEGNTSVPWGYVHARTTG